MIFGCQIALPKRSRLSDLHGQFDLGLRAGRELGFGVSPTYEVMLIRTSRRLCRNIAWDRKSCVFAKQKSVNQELQQCTIVICTSFLVLIRISIYPRFDCGNPILGLLEPDTVDASAGPASVKIKPRFLIKYEPLVFHLARNHAFPHAAKLAPSVGVGETQIDPNLRQRQGFPIFPFCIFFGRWRWHFPRYTSSCNQTQGRSFAVRLPVIVRGFPSFRLVCGVPPPETKGETRFPSNPFSGGAWFLTCLTYANRSVLRLAVIAAGTSCQGTQFNAPWRGVVREGETNRLRSSTPPPQARAR